MSRFGDWSPANASVVIDLADAHTFLCAHDICVRFNRPRDFDDGPSMIGRIRGAIGVALRKQFDELSSEDVLAHRSACDLPHAFEACFSDCMISPGVTGPQHYTPMRPFSLFTQQKGREICVRIRLFGRGSIWTRDLRRALKSAMENQGFNLHSMVSSRARPRPYTIWEEATLPGQRMEREKLRLITQSPLAFDRSGLLNCTAHHLVGTMINRSLAALSWCGFCVQADWQAISLQRKSVDLEDISLRPTLWTRWSGRKQKAIPMSGMEGAFTITGITPNLAQLATLSEFVGLGSHLSFGLGRCVFAAA